MGVVPPADGFLEFLREATADAGALLVFDEVITGFRVARGGAQELYGVEPDLTVLGKVLGGGLPRRPPSPGPRELMERLAPAGDVYQAGTLSGQPAGGRRRPRDPAPAGRRRLRAPRRADRPPRRRPRRARRRPPAPGRLGPRPPHPLLQPRAPGHRLRRRPGLRHRGPRPLLPRHARRAASTRRPPSSRPGSSRSPTTRRRSTAPSKPPPSPLDEALRERRRPTPWRRVLAAPRRQLRDEDTPISPHVVEPAEEPVFGPLAAAGPRAAAAPGEYALVVEAVREGYLLHYGEPRLLAGHDPDLALLAGDYLYALGIERLAALGRFRRRPRARRPDQPLRPAPRGGPRRQRGAGPLASLGDRGGRGPERGPRGGQAGAASRGTSPRRESIDFALPKTSCG